MHRMGVYLGLVEDEDEYAEDDVDGYGHGPERGGRDDYSEPRYSRDARPATPARAGAREYKRDHSREYGSEYDHGSAERGYDRSYAGDGAVAQVYTEEHAVQPTYQITALHPRTYNEARTIGEQFRKSTPVIMNLSDMDDADAKRLVDFAAGLTFGLHGRIERVTAKVFLLSPHNVTVTAQDKARIENGFFNQS
jgi:cell division inhibitor SepF